jgi:hypothetical protein
MTTTTEREYDDNGVRLFWRDGAAYGTYSTIGADLPGQPGYRIFKHPVPMRPAR